MKRVRLTHEGAYHHCMNRGINGLNIFSGHEMKAQFPDYLEDAIRRCKLRVFAYCIMDNHYHLILNKVTPRYSVLIFVVITSRRFYK